MFYRLKNMDSLLTWDEAMSMIYAGNSERKEFAQYRVRPLLEKIEKEIKVKNTKQNLKIEFFNKLIARDDGFILVECMAHLRKDFGDAHGLKVLSMILEEWEGQAKVPDSYDTFRSVLISQEKAGPIHICNALIMQARRLRGKAGVKPKNAQAAKNLVKEANEIWKREYEKEGVKPDENNFCLVPNRLYKYVIETQEIFCDARFSDMRKVWEAANKMVARLEEDDDWEGQHKPNLILKWWMYQVNLRASAVCIEPVKWKQAKDGMKEVEEELEGSKQDYYIRDIKDRSQKLDQTNLEKNTPYNDLAKMRGLLSDWGAFRHVDEDVLKFRRRGGKKQERDRKLVRAQNDFTDSLKDFNHYLFMGMHKSSFVSHSYARDEKQSRERLRKILVEISEGRRYVNRSDTNHSCFQLEILHRLLIYRIWWEVIGKDSGWFFGDDADMTRLSWNVPGKILLDIELDLEKIHISKNKNARWRKEIIKSREVFRDRDENLAKELEDRIREFEVHAYGRMQWPKGQDCILGLPYIPLSTDGKISPYDRMDPTMRHVGVNAAGADHEQRTESQ